MQIPVRLVYLLRPTVAIGVLLAVGFGTVAFTTTPFLLPEIAEHYDIGLTAASMISVFQLGGFVLSTIGAGRCLRPRPGVFTVALLISALANLGSAALPVFPLLVALRLLSGLALGVVAWYGWLQAFGDDRRMGDVAVTGPVIGVVAAPLIALVLEAGGAETLFLVLAAASLVPVAMPHGSIDPDIRLRSERNRAVPAARVILICLLLFTMGGSTVFQYAVVIGTGEPGLSPTTIAIAFSINAVVGIPAARRARPRRLPGPWMAVTATCALVMATATPAWLFLTALVFWGYAFWTSVPAAFKVLISRSRYPEERAGDAQAMMAAGRAAGPFLGGLLIDSAGETMLGIVGAAIMIVAAAGVFTVRTVAPPTSQTRHVTDDRAGRPEEITDRDR